ncbi:MAG: hypothetical protein K5931_11070 [Lachnospiraceae bacterium]|nr:hypothetical protein [Lachnospiraceae bacterium]
MKKGLALFMTMVLAFTVFASNLNSYISIVHAEDGGYIEEGSAEGEFLMDDFDQEEELRRIEEEQRRQQEEEERRQQEEIERQAAEEEARRQAQEAQEREAEEELRRIEEQREQERQRALEEEARVAEEAQKKAEEEAAAKKAKELAEQAEKEAIAAKKEAEELERKAKEEAKKDKSNYTISAISNNGTNLSTLDFGTLSVGTGGQKGFEIVNTGLSEVDLVYGLSNQSAPDVFNLVCMSNTHLYFAGGEDVTASFRVTLNPGTPAGTYTARAYFADQSDPGAKRGCFVNIRADIIAEQSRITGVSVYPSKTTLAVGSNYDFYSDVSGVGDYDSEVSWSVANNYSNGTRITQDGTLIVAADESSSSLVVVATSLQNPSMKGVANINLQRGSYNVKLRADPQKGGIVSGGGAVRQGDSIIVTAVPNKNYVFTGWVRDGSLVSSSTNYVLNNVQTNIEITATFRQNGVSVNVSANDKNAGTVAGGGNIAYGGKTTISAKANDGYVFLQWVENGNILSRNASLELSNVTYNRNIVAEFAKTSRNITLAANPAEGGKVSGAGTYEVGKGATVKATPASGYVFQNWTVNGQVVSKDAEYKIKEIYSDYYLTANFIKVGVTTFPISSGVATTGGNISPSGLVSIAQGQNITYTITPKSGFAILAVAVDGVQVGPLSSYTFTNVQGPHTIAAAFLQTDAGAKAAQKTGQKVQEKKVEKIEKTAENTASKEEVVDIKDASSGATGDAYVQEMDLSQIQVPSDEELGITEEAVQPAEISPVLQSLGMTREDAVMQIANGNIYDIFNAAFYEGTVDAYVNNELAPKTNAPDYHTLTREQLMQLSDDEINPSLPNIDVVVEKDLSQSEWLNIVDGGSGIYNISLTKTNPDLVSESTKKLMNSRAGIVPLQYFDLTFMKVVDGNSQNLTSIAEPMKVIIEIPDEIYKEGKSYSVLRDHEGTLTVLPDLDDDPKTITFATDKFSSYAISETVATSKSLAINFAIGALIAFIIALACLVILLVHQVKWAKKNKTARVRARRNERNDK